MALSSHQKLLVRDALLEKAADLERRGNWAGSDSDKEVQKSKPVFLKQAEQHRELAKEFQ